MASATNIAQRGNSSIRAELVRAFSDHRYLPRAERFLQYTIEDWPVRLVALDTVVEGQMAGQSCAERLVWSDRALAAERNQPTLIFMHHPPFATGIAGMDAIGMTGAAAMADILVHHPQVQLVTAGHLHHAIQRRVATTLAATCPSTAHQVTLDFDGSAPISFTLEPLAFQLHPWTERALLPTPSLSNSSADRVLLRSRRDLLRGNHPNSQAGGRDPLELSRVPRSSAAPRV